MLKQGAHYRLPDGSVIEVLRVNWGIATVRPIGKQQVEYETANGEHVSYETHYGSFTISANSVIEEVKPCDE